MKARRVLLLLVLGGLAQAALAISDNDYNDGMVELEHGFAACVDGWYRHVMTWWTLPGVCCGWNSVDRTLERAPYQGFAPAVNFTPFLQHIASDQCVLVPHQNVYAIDLYAQATPHAHWWWISQQVVAYPSRCTNDQ